MLDLILGIHLISTHVPAKDYQNNNNLGVYALYEGWTAGEYKNTLNRTSVYAGYQFDVWGPVSLTLGVVSGYQIKTVGQDTYGWSKGALAPMLAPSVKWGPARLWFIPQVGRASSVFHLSLEHEL